MKEGWLVGLALALFAPLCPPLRGDDDIQRRGIFLDSLDVNLVNVEVYVTQDGEPVTDLTAEDFEVFDDGQSVEITHFFRVEDSLRVGDGEPSASDKARDDTAEPDAESTAREPSAIIVLVDQPFLSPLSRKFAFDSLTAQLDRLMSAGTEVMVVSKDRQVHIEQRLTRRRADVTLALDRLAQVATRNYSTEVRRTVQIVQQGRGASESRSSGPGQTVSTSTAESDARAGYLEAQRHSQEVYADVQRSLGLLQRFLGSLSGLPGRKAILYVADRLPLRAGELVWRVWFEKYGRDWGTQFGAPSVDAALNEYGSAVVLQELLADATTNRVAFYPIGAGAGAGPNLAGAESRGLSGQARFLTRTSESDEGLRWLAAKTGGQAAIGRGNVEHFFDGLHQDLTQYYSLAYASPHRGDGEPHQIEVRARRADLEVRYLSQYRDKSAVQQMQEQTLATLMLGVGENPLEVRVEIGMARKEKIGRKEKGGKKNKEDVYVVPMEIRVPLANLVLLPNRKVLAGKLSIQFIVRDAKGRFSEPVRVPVPIEIPTAAVVQALSEMATYKTELVLRSGEQTIAVGVFDDFGSTSSSLNVEVDIGGRG